MLTELAIATAMVLATVMVHAVGLLVLNEVRVGMMREEEERGIHPLSVRGVAMIMALVLGLFVVHGRTKAGGGGGARTRCTTSRCSSSRTTRVRRWSWKGERPFIS